MGLIDDISQVRAQRERELHENYEALLKAEVAHAEVAMQKSLQRNLRPEILSNMQVRFFYQATPEKEWRDRGSGNLIQRITAWLVPLDLSPDAGDLGLEVTCAGERPDAGLHVRCYPLKRGPYGGQSGVTLTGAQDLEQQQDLLGRVFLPFYEEAVRSGREAREQRDRQATQNAVAAEQERRGKANHEEACRQAQALLPAKIAAVRAALSAERDVYLREHGWPAGKVLKLYRIDWWAGGDAEGPHYDSFLATTPTAEDGWFTTIQANKLVRVLLSAPQGYRATEIVFGGPGDLDEWESGKRRQWCDEAQVEVPFVNRYGYNDSVRYSERVCLEDTVVPRGIYAQLLGMGDHGEA